MACDEVAFRTHGKAGLELSRLQARYKERNRSENGCKELHLSFLSRFPERSQLRVENRFRYDFRQDWGLQLVEWVSITLILSLWKL